MSKKTPKMTKKDKCLFNVENMDDLAKDKKQSDKGAQIHPLLPKHPFRILMVGGSGQGKSNLLINMVYKPMVAFDRLYVYSSMIDQPKYKFLKRHYLSLIHI